MVWLADATKDAEMLAVDATGQVGTHHRTGRTPIAWMDRSPRDVNKKKKASFRSIDSICMLPFYCSNLSARTPSICIFSFFKLKIYIQLNQEAWAAAPIFSHLAPLMRFWKLSWTPVHPKTQTDGGKEGTHLYFDGYIYMGQCKIKRKKQPCGI